MAKLQSITKKIGMKARRARMKLIYETCQTQSAAMVEMQRRLADAGLYATMQAVNKASQELGWETVRQLKKMGKQ